MELKPNSRTFSTLNKMTQFPSNKTTHSFISKQINLDKELEPKEKRYYLNLSHRNAYNPFSNIIIIIVRGMQIVISIIMNLFKYIIKLKIKNDSKKNFLSISSLLINKEKYTLILFI